MSIVSSPLQELRAEIVSIGTELLLGEITDTNARWLAGRLPALGIALFRIQQVGDNLGRVQETLRQAWERADLLILTGGLGPTEDDLTREAISGLLGETMAVRPDLEENLRRFFAQRGREMPERNLKQATVIPSCEVLANPVGTAPGWWVRREQRIIIAMPGVPSEMRRMWIEEAEPRLDDIPHGGVIVSRTLKILGIGESAVEERLGELVRAANPTAATYARDDGIHVRLAARAADASVARAVLAPLEDQVRRLFGEAVYAADDEGLKEVTARRLLSQGLQVAVAESGLGGALCASVAEGLLAGGLVLPGDSTTLTEEDAQAAALSLAQRARKTFSAPVGLGGCLVEIDAVHLRIAVSVATEAGERVAVEEHATERADGPRRAVLLAARMLFQIE
ncbi:MAG TPA: CinA family nicotinamide mononucleotide deamidase-related protein [Chloroflexota bacterium]|nr:CinA family nicotinamide mononucleotide deamidase-related protein [Chloroflexota bacterium]